MFKWGQPLRYANLVECSLDADCRIRGGWGDQVCATRRGRIGPKSHPNPACQLA